MPIISWKINKHPHRKTMQYPIIWQIEMWSPLILQFQIQPSVSYPRLCYCSPCQQLHLGHLIPLITTANQVLFHKFWVSILAKYFFWKDAFLNILRNDLWYDLEHATCSDIIFLILNSFHGANTVFTFVMARSWQATFARETMTSDIYNTMRNICQLFCLSTIPGSSG